MLLYLGLLNLTLMSVFHHGMASMLTQLYAVTHPRRNIFSVMVSGGGFHGLQWLFTTPGASQCVMDGHIPYARASMDRFLHLSDDVGPGTGMSYSSPEATSLMAAEARNRAAQTLLAETSDLTMLKECNIFGIACSAALVSTQPKKSPHRCHVAIAHEKMTCVYSLTLEKGLRDREGEDALCSRLMMDAIRHASTEHSNDSNGEDVLKGDFAFAMEAMSATEQVELTNRDRAASSTNDVLDRICCRQSGHAVFVAAKHGPVGQFSFLENVQLPRNTLVFPGSFNPLHSGHVELVVAALKLQGAAPKGVPHCPVVFEIAAVNVDKPPLPTAELMARIEAVLSSPLLQAAGVVNFAVCITSEPLFLQKSRIFKDCTFVIGADTMSRLINAKYYQTHPETASTAGLSEQHSTLASHSMVAALATIAERGCRFIVGGRVPQDSSDATSPAFETLDRILRSSTCPLPPAILSIFAGIDEAHFRSDISSSALRRQVKKD